MGVSDFAMGQRTAIASARGVRPQSEVPRAEHIPPKSPSQLQSIALLRLKGPFTRPNFCKAGMPDVREILMQHGRK